MNDLKMLTFLALATVCSIVSSSASVSEEDSRLYFNDEGDFKILHLSDVHHHIHPDTPCRDVYHGAPCTGANTTDFINRLIETEKPDLVVYTGDIIDGDTKPASEGMDDMYGAAFRTDTKWAATLGNHDGQSDLNRPQVMEYILSLNGTLSEMNALGDETDPDTESFGNFFLEIFKKGDEMPSFRTWHLDSNTNDASINPEQISWFNDVSAKENAAKGETPALMFTHIPVQEYYSAVLADPRGICGDVREFPAISRENPGLVAAMEAEGSVKAMFVGHDHTNDFCAKSKSGIQLCYEGSPGYQGYGICLPGREGHALAGICYERRARITTIRDFGRRVTSYKRVDAWPETKVVDKEVLWSSEESQGRRVDEDEDSCERTTITQDMLDKLPTDVRVRTVLASPAN